MTLCRFTSALEAGTHSFLADTHPDSTQHSVDAFTDAAHWGANSETTRSDSRTIF